MVETWLQEQKTTAVREVDIGEETCKEVLLDVAKAFSLRLSFYQATWELINAGVVVSAAETGSWEANLGYRMQGNSGGLPLRELTRAYPARLQRLSLDRVPISDTDIFLRGIDCGSLHSGILEAIEQSLSCFQRGLYMPATVMLAAAAEATWTECGLAIARHQSNNSLLKTLSDEPGFAKLVTEVRKVLEPKSANSLLVSANRKIHDVHHAEVWTTMLRERRNALHWGKAKSFIADHAETGTLLMAAPQHLGTLEAIRVVA